MQRNVIRYSQVLRRVVLTSVVSGVFESGFDKAQLEIDKGGNLQLD